MSERKAIGALFVIAGYNGLRSAQTWVEKFKRCSPCYFARAYSWRDAGFVRRDIAALPPGSCVTLIGHSLGGGYAQSLVQSLPAGTIDFLITVAPFGPQAINHRLTRQKVRYWLNILPYPKKDWRALARNIAAPALLGWREQGLIPTASENYASGFAHHDFYKMMTDRFGAVEPGKHRILELV